MDFTKPDKGVVIALQQNVPHMGMVAEFGFGNGRNICSIAAQLPHVQCIGYETDHQWLPTEDECRWNLSNLRAKYGNALHIINTPTAYSFVVVGMIMYNPKCIVREFMASLWPQILPGGILHLQVATIRDFCANENFVNYYCLPDGKDPHSYVYSQPFICDGNEGIRGGSFWTLREIRDLLQPFRPFHIVHFEKDEFTIPDQYGDDVLRSFYFVTIKKPVCSITP